MLSAISSLPRSHESDLEEDKLSGMCAGRNDEKKLPELPRLVWVVAALTALQALLVAGGGVYAAGLAMHGEGQSPSALPFSISAVLFAACLGAGAWGVLRQWRHVWSPLMLTQVIAVLILIPSALSEPASLLIMGFCGVIAVLLMWPDVRRWVRHDEPSNTSHSA